MAVRIESQKLCVEYCNGWHDFMVDGNDEWAKTIKEAEDKIGKKPTKGIGKGKGKNASH